MKKLVAIIGSFLILQACSNNGGESGAVNDGFNGAGDTNGGLADTPYTNQSATDTSKGEDQVGTSKRDTFKHE